MKRMMLAIPILGVMALAFLLLALAPAASSAPIGTAAAGKAFWDAQWCSRCHGANAEGAYGPDLAGRGLSFQHVARAVHQPWGVMPAYTTQQVSDQTVADLVAYFNSLPAASEPGPWRTTVPAGAPLGQRLLIETAGCGQCHGDVLGNPRRSAGGEGADFAWFEELVYHHTQEFPTGRMGNFSKARLTEDTLLAIWNWMTQDVGLRVPVTAAVNAAAAADGNVNYTLTVQNTGKAGKGLAAGNLYFSMVVPAGSTVVGASTSRSTLVSASGSSSTLPAAAGYQGVQATADGSNVASWLAPVVGPQEKVTFTITVRGNGAAGGSQAFVRWLSPTRSASPGVDGEYIQTGLVRP
ncbi:MAG: c-type cytochrome [Chloroflexi bacterium]|nr:c-type cytochrome [Chloroflexota bacterium]